MPCPPTGDPGVYNSRERPAPRENPKVDLDAPLILGSLFWDSLSWIQVSSLILILTLTPQSLKNEVCQFMKWINIHTATFKAMYLTMFQQPTEHVAP